LRVWEVAESLPNASKYRLIFKLITQTQKHKTNPPFFIHVVISWCGLLKQNIMKAKMSYCPKCEKAVRVIIEDLISANELKQFDEEVEHMKLQVKYIPIEEYNLQLFCNGKCSTCL